MKPTFKDLTNYLVALGTADIGHSEKSYLAHAIGVYTIMKKWGCSEELCNSALFHSIYGTQQFQGFTLSIDRRPEVQDLIGNYAEKIAYINCFIDRGSLDGQVRDDKPAYAILNRESGEEIIMPKEEFDDLVRLHLFDWLEQVERSQGWDQRRAAYRSMAERLGGQALEAYDGVFAKEPVQV
ncbi:MAG: DUF6817 domain-containing protein [Chloroflexota bacterium]